jgi:hypothetical protein
MNSINICCGGLGVAFGTTNITITGYGCNDPALGLDPLKLLITLYEMGATFPRIDISIDDYCLNNYGKIFQAVKKHRVVSKFKGKSKFLEYETDCSTPPVAWGSPKSDLQILLYDKGIQKNVSYMWHRWEIRLRSKSATKSFVEDLLSGKSIGTFAMETLGYYIRIARLDKSNVYDPKNIAPFWKKFLLGIEPRGFTFQQARKKPAYKRTNAFKYVDKAVADDPGIIEQLIERLLDKRAAKTINF